MGALSRHDKARFVTVLERIDDERARYFLMMLCDAMADYAHRHTRSHRHGAIEANTSPEHLAQIAARLNGS